MATSSSMLIHIIVPASSTVGEFFKNIFPDAECLLNRLIECQTSDTDGHDVLNGWDVQWAELESPRYVIFQPPDQISAYFLERVGKEFFHDNTLGSNDAPEGHILVKVLTASDPCILARIQMLEDRVTALESTAAPRENHKSNEENSGCESNVMGAGNDRGNEWYFRHWSLPYTLSVTLNRDIHRTDNQMVRP